MALYFNRTQTEMVQNVDTILDNSTTLLTNTDNCPDVYDFTPRLVSVQTVAAGTTTWTVAAHRLFTVTGTAKVKIYGVVTTTLVGAATLEVGVAGATAGLIAQVANATTLAAGDILTNASTATLVPCGIPSDFAIVKDIDIDLKVASTTVTAGRITFYCEYIPISAGATVEAAVWD